MRCDPPVECLAELGDDEWPRRVTIAQASKGIIAGAVGHRIIGFLLLTDL